MKYLMLDDHVMLLLLLSLSLPVAGVCLGSLLVKRFEHLGLWVAMVSSLLGILACVACLGLIVARVFSIAGGKW